MADGTQQTRVDIIERIPWSWDRTGGHQAPRWRFLEWKAVGGVLSSLENVMESGSLPTLVECTNWAVRPTPAQVRQAMSSLGTRNVDGTRASCIDSDPHWRLTVEDGRARAMDRFTGMAMTWDGRGWSLAGTGWYAHP